MPENGTFRRLRGAIGNALLWGAGFAAFGAATLVVLYLAGVVHGRFSWLGLLGMAVKFGVWGVVAGGAFASVVRLLYRGRRVASISWVRFGVIGGLVTGAFVPLFMQLMNLLSGDGMVAWRLVLDDAVWAAVFGAVAAGGSMWLAQRARGHEPASSPDRLDDAARRGHLASPDALDRATTTPARSAQR
jgi:hypothetical protein